MRESQSSLKKIIVKYTFLLTRNTTLITFQCYCGMSPAEWVALVTGDNSILNDDDESGKSSWVLLCAGAAVTDGGEGDVASSTGHIPEVPTGWDRFHSQDRSTCLLCKYTVQIQVIR